MFCPLAEKSAYISDDISALDPRKSYHFVRPGRQAYTIVNIARHKLRQQKGTHLNFFNGFEYEPTFDCDAMMANAGKTDRNLLEKRRWRFWSFKTKTLWLQETWRNILSARKSASDPLQMELPSIITLLRGKLILLLTSCKHVVLPYNIAPDHGTVFGSTSTVQATFPQRQEGVEKECRCDGCTGGA